MKLTKLFDSFQMHYEIFKGVTTSQMQAEMTSKFFRSICSVFITILVRNEHKKEAGNPPLLKKENLPAQFTNIGG